MTGVKEYVKGFKQIYSSVDGLTPPDLVRETVEKIQSNFIETTNDFGVAPPPSIKMMTDIICTAFADALEDTARLDALLDPEGDFVVYRHELHPPMSSKTLIGGPIHTRVAIDAARQGEEDGDG